jgi:hypothetical protein
MTDLGDPTAVRERNKRNREGATERKEMLKAVMGLKQGRALVADWLARCHVNAPSFNPDALRMAFAEGERNIGLQMLADITSATPAEYATMLREIGEKDAVRSVVEGDEGGLSRPDAEPDAVNSNTGADAPANSGGPGPEPD